VSINRHLAALRRCVAWHGDQIQPMSGEIEVDEPSVGARRGRGNRGRGAFGKTAVFGLFKRHDRWLGGCGYGRHFKVARGRDEFVRGGVPINGIEGFWGFAKSRLAKFRSMNQQTFYLHLKGCEFRFNHRHNEIYQILLKSCLENPIKLS